MSNSLAIIIARGGSKRIPLKNIRSFLGKPIIAYSIEAAKESECFSEVMTSTDSDEIAEIALKFGAKVPFLRSKSNSDDFATTPNVALEVLQQYEQKYHRQYENFCCIYPTAPFITAKKLQLGFEMLNNNDVDSIIPVVRFRYPIQRSFVIHDNLLTMMHPENIGKRSQDLEATYHDCGQFYWLKTQPFLKNHAFFTNRSMPMEMSELHVQDIDTEEDWEMAEIKYGLINQK